MKKIVKKFNNFVNETIFNVQNKTNNIFNNLFRRKKNNESKISNFNKSFIIIFSSIFLYLFYLLIPLLYDKNWVQNTVEKKLLNEFKINLSSSADISYLILPAPHFLIKDSKILIDDNKKLKSIAEIKKLKVFLSQKNFFDKEKIELKKVVINNANFLFLRSDIKKINEFSNKKFSNKKIQINNSKIFFKDNLNQIIAITKLDKATLFFDEDKLLNLFKLKGDIFAIPFTFDFKISNKPTKNKEVNIKAKTLKLNILNKSLKNKNKSTSGTNIISFLNSTINTEYESKNELVIFKSENSMTKNSEYSYNGKLSINPFDLDLNIDLGNYKIFQLFNINSIFNEFIKSGALINENISIKISATSKANYLNKIYQNANINFNIINGKINLDNSKLINDNIGTLKLIDSNLYIENNKLMLNSDVSIDIKDTDRLYSFLNTRKKSRKNIKNILLNLDYDFLSNQIKFNYVKVDNNKVSEQFLRIIDGFNDNNLNNLTKSRRLINELFNIYEG
tara:strand:- start:1386 stop:2906 length:1521 start_codon:yes stop_codon:yes gene_type:complete